MGKPTDPGWLAALLGLALWPAAPEVGGDGLFHLARARKLLELDDLSDECGHVVLFEVQVGWAREREEVGEEIGDVVQRVRALRMAGDLRGLPR